MSDPVYSIVSWVRRGLGSFVSGQPATNYASVPVSISVNGSAVSGPSIRLLGPGDINGLDARAVIRTEPRENTDAFEPNYLAMVELALPDLPWMFTPAGDSNGRLQPWICLIVVPDAPGAEIEVTTGGMNVLRLDAPLDPKAELPDLKTIDFWAHAQVTGGGALDGDPAGTVSRLLSPRKLEANTGYIACIVPTYHAGINAALGLPVDDSDTLLAWDGSQSAPFVLPAYYHFRFRTGPGGDFASLAEKIMPPAVKVTAGTRPMNVSDPGFGLAALPANSSMNLEGALGIFVPAAGVITTVPAPTAEQAAYARELPGSLNPPPPVPYSTAVPVMAPPTYGSTQAGVPLPDAGKPPNWLGELNLDPKARVAASAGTQVVQKNQEALVASAWDQVGDILKVNRLLRQAQLAREVTSSLNNRHLQTVSGDGVFLQMTAPLHSRVLTAPNATLRSNIEASILPIGAVSAAMRKLARRRGPIGRQLSPGTPALVERLNALASTKNALRSAAPVFAPRGMVAMQEVAAKPSQAPGSAAGNTGEMTGELLNTAGAGWKVAAGAVEDHKPPPTTASDAELAVTSGTPTDSLTAAGSIPPATAATGTPLIDWSADVNLPRILKEARPTLPSPMIFPSTPGAVEVVKQQFTAAATAVSVYLQVAPPPQPDQPPLADTVRTQLQARMDPEKTIEARVRARLNFPGTGPDALQPLHARPEFPEPPMYTALAELSAEWMLPGISNIPIDSATLLAPNSQFIESYMIGLNEELSRELIWRQYPTDPQTTYFQNFWGGPQADIPPVQMFDPNGGLGSHVTHQAGGNSVVLLIRANLFRRYPNAVVSAVQAQWVNNSNGTGKIRVLADPVSTTTHQYPIFRGEIGPDTTFFGFAIDDPIGLADPGAGRPGWYFVIEEHITEPRFGLEPGTAAGGATSWNDLRWQDLSPELFLNPAAEPSSGYQRENVTWGQNAASMAFILMRRPVRVALHALALIGPQANDTGKA